MSIPVIGFSWRQLGAFIVSLRAVSDDMLDEFAAIGGRWVVPVVYNDPTVESDNRMLLPSFIPRARERGIRVGGWFNTYGEDAAKYAADIKRITFNHSLALVVVDAEAAYQGNTKMAVLVDELRKVFPAGTKAIGVSTNAANDSVVYNGRQGAYPAPKGQSFRAKNVHLLPQWYSAPRYWGIWTHADQNMEWVHHHGMLDNWEDASFPDSRAVRKDMIHGTLEVTGVESAVLKTSIDECIIARKQWGLGFGISLYMLENMPAADYALVHAQKGILYV